MFAERQTVSKQGLKGPHILYLLETQVHQQNYENALQALETA